MSEDLKNLEDDYPHVCESLIIFWGHQELREYIDGLFVNTRNKSRQGFTRYAMDELVFLRDLHEYIVPAPKPKSPWCISGRIFGNQELELK